MTATATSTHDDGAAAAVDGSPIVALDGVSFQFNRDERLLVDFDLMISRKEFVVLLGPSGCGKSTVMNLIAGLLKPDAGRISFDGNELIGVNTRVGYMTQGDTLLPWRTVEANVGLPLKMRSFPKHEIRGRVDDFLEMLELQEAKKKFPAELSGGMKRRALLARSLIYQPRMLLMDEPFAALDAQLRERLQEELLDTVRKLEQSVLFVTHDVTEAISLADRVIVMARGGRGVMAEVVVPFGPQRRIADLWGTTEFMELERDLRAALWRTR